MRILFISAMSGSSWGGSEILWFETASRLLDCGHKVMASSAKWPITPKPIARLRSMGVQVQERQLEPDSFVQRVGSKILRRNSIDQRLKSCWNEILKFRPDLVCVSQGDTICGIDWMLRCKKNGLPYVSVAHANFEQWWPDDVRVTAITEAYLGAKKAYFVSKANLALFERQLAISLPGAEVVFNPCSVQREARLVWPTDAEVIRLACVGRLDPGAKGQDLLFHVLAQPKWRDRPVEFSLFGSGRWEMSLRRLAMLDGINDQVKFAGHVEDVCEIWRTHHALVLPSRFEGLPLTIVEAMMCGRPAIVTDVAGNRELLEDGVTGFVAEAPTVHHLDEAMERAWQRRHEWHAIGGLAAESIRRSIPLDPAKDFADKLLGLCQAN